MNAQREDATVSDGACPFSVSEDGMIRINGAQII